MLTTANEFVVESPPSIIKQRKIVMSDVASPNPNTSLIKKPATEDVTPRAASQTVEKQNNNSETKIHLMRLQQRINEIKQAELVAKKKAKESTTSSQHNAH